MELSDLLVVVHMDNVGDEHFVTGEVEARITEYLATGKPVYELSCFEHPKEREGVIKITGANGGEKLEDQVAYLKRELRERSVNIEIVGVSWMICVDYTAEQLNRVPRLNAIVNYDCTDLPGDYDAVTKLSVVVDLGKPMPIPSDAVLERYRATQQA